MSFRKYTIGGLVVLLGIISVVLLYFFVNPDLYSAELSLREGDNICHFTKAGNGYIARGTWKSHLNNLPNPSGPEDQFGILGWDINCTGTCNAQTAFTATHSIVLETNTLPY